MTTLRQPGSTLKPFTYALAFEQGFTPATVLADVPSHFPTAEEGIVYTPRNYDGGYRGPLRARLALAGSENVPAVALLSKVGPPALLRLLRAPASPTSTSTADYYGLGLTLGDAEVTLEQLVTAYATFARGGMSSQPAMLRRRLRAAGRSRSQPAHRASGSPTSSATRNAREFVFGRGGSLDFPFPVAVKTGTSQAYHDNWTIGYTRDVTVGVWVGNFDRTALRNSSGVTGAGPIFHAVMLAAMKRAPAATTTTRPIVDRPDDLERAADLRALRTAAVAVLSGHRKRMAPARCAGRVLRVASRERHFDWPAEYREWAAARERRTTVRAARHRRPRHHLPHHQPGERHHLPRRSDAAPRIPGPPPPRHARRHLDRRRQTRRARMAAAHGTTHHRGHERARRTRSRLHHRAVAFLRAPASPREKLPSATIRINVY